MFSRVLWRKVLKRYKKILGMEANTSLPSNVKRCFFIGLGLGTGLVASAYVAKKLYEQNNSRELVFALNQVTNEIKELRVSMVHHFERTASEFSNEQVLTSVKRRYRLGNVQQQVLRENETLPQDDSSSEDDFFDLLDEEIDIEQSNESESLQDRSILNFDELIKKCDKLAENEILADNEREIGILEDLLTRNTENVEVLMRCTRAYKAKANLAEDEEGRKEAVYKGMEYGERAVEISEDHPTAQKWFGVVLGMAAGMAPLMEQIPLAHKFRKHVKKAIELNPDDSTNYHLLGRWCFEIASLPWWKRQAAATLIAEPPTSSYEEALSLFEQAEELGFTGPKSNRLFIGKCHQSLGDVEKAKEWLTKSLELPVKDYDDRTAHEEATEIMQTL